MTLADFPNISPLTNYNRSQADKAFADADETLLGHLILEQGYSLQAAIEDLRPCVKQARAVTEISQSWNRNLGFGAIGVAVLLATSIPTAGLALAIGPFLAGSLSLKFWNDSRSEKPKRDAEYKLLRDVVPQLPEFLWSIHLKGCSVIEIVGAYDGLVSAIEGAMESGKPITEGDVSAYLWARVDESRKMNATLKRDIEGEALPTWIDSGNNKSAQDDKPQTIDTQAFQNPDKQIAPRTEAAIVAPTALQPPLPIPQDIRSMLIAKLKEDCPLLLRLVKSHPIRAVGVQRSGKTTLVKRLCLLRMVLLPGHQTIAATPHYEPKNPYPSAFKVAGIDSKGKRDYKAIEEQWDSMADRVERCETSNLSYVWDEFGLFDKVMPPPSSKSEPDKIKSVLTSCLRETKKFGILPIFIVHGETAAFLPGSTGLVTIFLNSTVRVEAIGEMIEGDDGLEEIRPTGKFTVTWLDGTKEEGQLPSWLTEDYLLGLIGNRSIAVEAVKPSSQSVPSPSPSDITGTWREDFAKNLPPGLTESEFKARYDLEQNLRETWETKQPIAVPEVAPVTTAKVHPLSDKFDRLASLLEGKDSLPIREIQRALSCKSEEAQQIAQMFCVKSKSYKFVQTTKPNGTVSKSIDRV